jgi:hypothetical protein
MVNNFLLVTAILGAVTVIFSGFLRYMQCEKFGVQFRLTHHNIYDFIDTLVALVIVAGFIAALPIFLFFNNSDISVPVFFIIVICLYGGANLVFFVLWPLDIKKKWLKFTILTLAVSVVLLVEIKISNRMADVNVPGFAVLMIAILYICAAIFTSVIIVNRRIKGQKISGKNSTTMLTVDNDGKMYIIAMRYSGEKWILIPCIEQSDIESRERVLEYKKGEFIVKSLDGLTVKQNIYADVRPLE